MTPMLSAARVTIVLSTVGAIAAHAWLSPDAGGLRWATILALLIGLIGGGLWPRATQTMVLAFAHVWPLLVFLVAGQPDFNALMVWVAALTGLALAGSPLERWSLPRAWQMPVAAWALVLAFGWPIILWRELDFTLITFSQPDVPNGMFAGPARQMAQLATGNTAAQLCALLVVDWLWARYRKADARTFVREVVGPLTVGTVLAMVVGLYQGLIDVSWLSGEPWPRLGRAAGTFFDANAFGAVSALWGALAAGAALIGTTWRIRFLGAALLALSAGAVWLSGSRTALMGWLMVTIGLGVAVLRTGHISRKAAAMGVAVLAVAIVLAAQAGGSGTAIQRLLQTVPRPTLDSVSAFARALWDRDGYGIAAMRMVREFPATGVGPGAFPILAPDYAYVTTGRLIPPDNAQNWWRHAWTELGLLGSLPPFLCSILVAAALVQMFRRRRSEPLSPLVGGATIALGLMALVGPPMFHPSVLQTAAVMLFWVGWLAYRAEGPEPVRRAEALASAGPNGPALLAHGLVLVLVWLLPLVWAGLTLRLALLELRPPYRAERIGWRYGYGFSAAEAIPGGERRWATTRAVGVVPAPERRIALTLELPHEDLASRPVRVRVSDRHTVVLDTVRNTREPFACVVDVAPGERWVMVQIETSRAWTTTDGMARAIRASARFE